MVVGGGGFRLFNLGLGHNGRGIAVYRWCGCGLGGFGFGNTGECGGFDSNGRFVNRSGNFLDLGGFSGLLDD